MNIVLTGFRATGKTTVGRLLARRLGYGFVDTDAKISQRLGASIAEIVTRHGWPFFREAERCLLAELPGLTRTVIATGGGAVSHGAEWQALRARCLIVWLDADQATIRGRLANDAVTSGQRPSLTGMKVGDEIAELMAERLPLYAAGSDLRLPTDARSVADLVEEIIKAVAGHKSQAET